jgi:hypothetical protein
MAQDPAFLMYYKDILVSCAHWEADELGWYLRLICHQADKPEGLPADDIEALALLAGVKFSQYERFKQCWQRTLLAKWEQTEHGTLLNLKQDETLEKRRKYHEKQQLRGLIGSFVRRARTYSGLSEAQGKHLSKQLFSLIKIENSKEENELCFKRTLVAYIGNANGNGNVLGKEKGVGEETPQDVTTESVFDVDLLKEKVLLDAEFKREFEQRGIPEDKLELWLKNFNKHLRFSFGKDVKKSENKYRWHFGNWLVSQSDYDHPENYKILKQKSDGNNIAGKHANSSKTGTSEERIDALQKW